MPFPLPPETWDPDDEYGRAQINEFMASMYHALQRERERINLIEENAGTIRPGPFVGHPGQPVLGTCADDIGVGGASIFAVFITEAHRSTGEAFNGPIQAAEFNVEDQDDDGMYAGPIDDKFTVVIGGNYDLVGNFAFQGPAAPGGATNTATILVNGGQVAQTVQAIVASVVNSVDVATGSSIFLGPGDLITLAYSHNYAGAPGFIAAGGTLTATRTTEAPPAEANSYCLAVNFSGVPGHIQVPRDTFPLLAYTLLEHWGRWQDTGNGDIYLGIFSTGHAGTPGNMDLVFTVPIPRGFTGWATNAMVLRYRLGFSGLAGAASITATLVVIDTRNGKETAPVPNVSFKTHGESGGVIDVPYGEELTVTKDQLAELAGFREGTAIRLRFRVALPGVHGSGVVGMGHLELNFA